MFVTLEYIITNTYSGAIHLIILFSLIALDWNMYSLHAHATVIVNGKSLIRYDSI